MKQIHLHSLGGIASCLAMTAHEERNVIARHEAISSTECKWLRICHLHIVAFSENSFPLAMTGTRSGTSLRGTKQSHQKSVNTSSVYPCDALNGPSQMSKLSTITHYVISELWLFKIAYLSQWRTDLRMLSLVTWSNPKLRA